MPMAPQLKIIKFLLFKEEKKKVKRIQTHNLKKERKKKDRKTTI
jgi:hypothetical protein